MNNTPLPPPGFWEKSDSSDEEVSLRHDENGDAGWIYWGIGVLLFVVPGLILFFMAI